MFEFNNETINVLHKNKAGFIIQCENCEQLYISFGNIISHMSEEAFLNLYNALNNISENIDLYTYNINEENKIIFNTPLNNLKLSFSLLEFNEIIEMINQAKLSLDIKKIIN